AQSAASLLKSFGHSDFVAKLEGSVVAVTFDDAAVKSDGLFALHLAVNLLARLYPRIALISVGKAAERASSDLVNIAKAINPQITVSDSAKDVAVNLVFGESNSGASPTIHVGSDGWIAEISAERDLRFNRTGNPFGAGVAACLGCANVFRLL